MKFTSVFVDPTTGELFRSGRYGPEDNPMYQEQNGFVWYAKKMFAEHGAAARAHDCLEYRRARDGNQYPFIGNDTPYQKADRPPLSQSLVPAAHWKKIADAQARAPRYDVDSDEELERELFS